MTPLLPHLQLSLARVRTLSALTSAISPSGAGLTYSATLARRATAESLGRLVAEVYAMGRIDDAEAAASVHRVAWLADRAAELLDRGPMAVAEIDTLAGELEALLRVAERPMRIVRGVGTEGRMG